jgi:hypothetical protein
LARGATIYAEVLGGNVNSGGQRGLGTMTAQIRLQYKVHTKCFEKMQELALLKTQSTAFDCYNKR